MKRKISDKTEYGMGYADAQNCMNKTGKTDSYDEGWIKGYQDLRGISWERRYGEYK